MEFLFEIDKIKDIFRQSLVVEGKREENDAEHSWHMALVA
ncbi:MAG: HD domain-containing protein, partial [Cetobacterium sp.]